METLHVPLLSASYVSRGNGLHPIMIFVFPLFRAFVCRIYALASHAILSECSRCLGVLANNYIPRTVSRSFEQIGSLLPAGSVYQHKDSALVGSILRARR